MICQNQNEGANLKRILVISALDRLIIKNRRRKDHLDSSDSVDISNTNRGIPKRVDCIVIEPITQFS